jgi:hypothetical protein
VICDKWKADIFGRKLNLLRELTCAENGPVAATFVTVQLVLTDEFRQAKLSETPRAPAMNVRTLSLILILLLAAPVAPGRKNPAISKSRPSILERIDRVADCSKDSHQPFQLVGFGDATTSVNFISVSMIAHAVTSSHTTSVSFHSVPYALMSLQL